MSHMSWKISEQYMNCSPSKFRELILLRDKYSEEAAYYFIRYKIRPELERIYKQFDVKTELGDVFMEFFLYLRDGKASNYERIFQGIENVQDPNLFDAWTIQTFKFFMVDLVNNENKETERKRSYAKDCSVEFSGKIDYNEEIKYASLAMAKMEQDCVPDDRFILHRIYMSKLCRTSVIPNEDMAKAMNISHENYRVRSSRLKKRMHELVIDLKNGKTSELDSIHIEMANKFFMNFEDIRQIIIEIYESNVKLMSCYNAIQILRNKPREDDMVRFSLTGGYEDTAGYNLASGRTYEPLDIDFSDLCPRKNKLSTFNDVFLES